LSFNVGCQLYYYILFVFFTFVSGEQSLPESATRRNKGRDPSDRARLGFKVDVMIEYQDLDWTPVVGCVEVAGGLPQCSRSKEWSDTLKLALELRDLWASTTDRLAGMNTKGLVYWGLLVIGGYITISFALRFSTGNNYLIMETGRKLRVYAFSAAGGLFHFVLVHETPLPSSCEDLGNIEVACLLMREYKEKLDATRNLLCDLSKIKMQQIARGKRALEGPKMEPSKKPKIVDTPTKKR